MAIFAPRHVWIVVILCVALLLVSGIILPKLLSKHYFDLRSELSELNKSVILDYDENIVPSDTETGDQVNTIHSSKLDQDSSISKSMQYDGASSVREVGTLPRRVKRSKRQASNEDGNEYFAWHFNLNISRHKNPASPILVGNIKPDVVDNSKKSDLNAAIYLEGKGPNQTYDMLKALASAGAFIRSVFGEGVQNLTYAEIEKNDEDDPINDVLQTGSDIKGINHRVSVKSDICKGNETKCKRRRGRFFDFFFTRRTPVVKTTQSIGNEVTSENPHEATSTISSDKNETGFNIGKNIFAHTGSQDGDFDESHKNSQAEVPVSKSEHSPTSSVSCSTKDGCEPLGNLNGVTEVTSWEFQNITAEKEECTNCGLNFKENETKISSNFDITAEFSAYPFTDEKLEDFCMNLVHQLGESMPFLSVNESSEEDGKNKESNLSTPPKLKVFDCFNLLGASEEKSKADLDVIEDSFLVNTDATDSSNESAKDAKRNPRILSWLPFGFGSGRSGLDAPFSEEKLDEPTEPNEDSKAETENEPTIKDCISYFRKNQNIKMFPKPNLMDVIRDSNIEITDFANATISPKLKEQQIQFITNFLETIAINCAVEKDGTHSKSSTEEKERVTRNGSTRTSVTDLKWIDTQVTSEGEYDEGIPQVTEKERDERIFDFGSGNDASPEIDNLRFINSNSSEEKLQETSSAASKYNFDPVTSVNFVSNSDFEATSNQGRFFVNLEFGSGEGRQLPKDSDIYAESTEHIEIGCKYDCFVETTSVQTDDCNDNGCYSEQPFEQTFSRENLQKQSDDENDCYNDCSAFIPNDSNVTEIKGNIFYNNSEFKDGNLTSSNLKFFNEHGTEMSFIPENADSLECDDCIDGLLDKNVTNSENNSFQIGFGNLTSTPRSHENDCDDCGYQLKTEIQNPESDIFKIASTYADSRSLNDAVSENILESSEFQAVKDTDRTEAVETATNIREEFETERNISRFLPIFLTGSGDGGLFGDSGGRINLTEANSNDKPPRRARLDDAGEIDECDDCGDLPDIQGILKETVKDNLTQFTTENSNPDGEILKSSMGPYEGKSNQTMFATEAAKESFTSEVSSNILDFFGDILTTTEHQPRFCNSASECNSDLNERCVTTDLYHSICSCGRAFVRNRITGKCTMKSSYKADLKLPAENYVNDLGNPYSPRYKQKQGDANKMMYALLKDNPGLAPIVADVTFAGFRSGSLIMSWDIVIAAEDESEAEMVSHLRKDLNRALLDEGLKEKVSFNISNAYVLSVSSTMDPCTSKELHYCYRNSQCVRNRSLPGGYECRCEGGHMDVSLYPEYPAESCEASCASDYCGHHGNCVWVPDEGRHCVCKDWYFGDRCGISGQVVVAGFSANVLVFIILMLVLFMCKKRHGRSRTYGRTPRHRDSNQPGILAISAGRVSDVIAMEENIGARAGKISHISTPVQNIPVIQVIRPTLSESSISIYDDSTFDVTPTSESGQKSLQQETSAVGASVS